MLQNSSLNLRQWMSLRLKNHRSLFVVAKNMDLTCMTMKKSNHKFTYIEAQKRSNSSSKKKNYKKRRTDNKFESIRISSFFRTFVWTNSNIIAFTYIDMHDFFILILFRIIHQRFQIILCLKNFFYVMKKICI